MHGKKTTEDERLYNQDTSILYDDGLSPLQRIGMENSPFGYIFRVQTRFSGNPTGK